MAYLTTEQRKAAQQKFRGYRRDDITNMKYIIGLTLLFVAQIYAQQHADKPDRHPYVQCKINLYDCLRLDEKSNSECLVEYKNCMSGLLPTLPSIVAICNKELKSCLASASGVWEQAKCMASYSKCLIPTNHPYFKCKIDFVKCLKDDDKFNVQCVKEYGICMKQLLPSVPPYVTKCNSALSSCLSTAKTFSDVRQCSVDYGKCIKNGSS